jgi:hypothetical protein
LPIEWAIALAIVLAIALAIESAIVLAITLAIALAIALVLGVAACQAGPQAWARRRGVAQRAAIAAPPRGWRMVGAVVAARAVALEATELLVDGLEPAGRRRTGQCRGGTAGARGMQRAAPGCHDGLENMDFFTVG